LEAFCDKFDLRRHIRFGVTINSIARSANGSWIVNGDHFDYVAIATGQTNEPFVPDEYPGLAQHAWRERFQGIQMHAADYVDPTPFVGKRVLVVGLGLASGSDIAQEISYVASEVYLSQRHGVFIYPRFLLGRPILHCFTWLGFYVPPVQWLVMFVLQLSMSLRTGSPWSHQSLTGLRNWDGNLWHVLVRLLFSVKNTRSRLIDVFSYSVKVDSSDLASRCAMGAIRARGSISHFTKSSVTFDRNPNIEHEIDAIVWATGYKRSASWEFQLLGEKQDQLDQRNQTTLSLVDYVFSRNGIAFLLKQHPAGPHWPIIAAQTQYVARVFSKRLVSPIGVREELLLDVHQSGPHGGLVNTVDEVLRYNLRMGRRLPSLLELILSGNWRFLFEPIQGHIRD
jgi:hypothetical protein